MVNLLPVRDFPYIKLIGETMRKNIPTIRIETAILSGTTRLDTPT